MAALRLALDLGARALELDARRSADGELVVIHDESLDRTSDAVGAVADLTYEQILGAQLLWPEGADPHFIAAHSPARVPRLRDVFDAFPGVEITVDVKDTDATDAVVELIAEHSRVADTILYVDDGTSLAAFDAYAGRRATSTRQALLLALRPGHVASAPPRAVPEVIHTPLRRWLIPIVTPTFVRRMHGTGRPVQVWTVDDPATMVRLADWGVDGIITNDVRTAVQVLNHDQEA
jgi:glycerophosphoryl diester phosphodiesterase